MEEMTTPTEETTTATEETAGETVTTAVTLAPMEQTPENPVHQLYSMLGCNLDHVPANNNEAFTMGLQFVAVSILLVWFFKFMWYLAKTTFYSRW